jgi:hypothetical protein
MVPTLLVIFTLAMLYWFPIRRWMTRWGTTPSDLTRVMAGDSLLVDPTYAGTMAVSVSAPPEDIWPWLVQIGYQRGGLYSYDWLDRLFGYLGDRRANAVKDYLVSRGVAADRLRTVSYGEERPKYDNSREETRRLNRRAALVINLR